MHHAFLYISLPSLHDYDLNCLVSRFIDNVNIRRRISLTLFKLGYLLGGPVINSVFGRRCRKTVPLGREDTRVWYRETNVLTNGFIGFSLARILFVPRLRPHEKPRRSCEPEEGYLRCSKRFDHRSHSIIFLLFEFKAVDDHDDGAGKLREMHTLHTNPHAVHGGFTLKDDCERQVWNAGAVS